MLDTSNRARHPWFTAIYLPGKLASKPVTMYLTTSEDATGKMLEAGKTYSLTVPKDVPVKQFWSLTVYDRETWAFIYSPEMLPGLSSRDVSKMKTNADGSVTLYVGPKAPEGLDSNWIPTSNKAPYLMFRFYGHGRVLRQVVRAAGRRTDEVIETTSQVPADTSAGACVIHIKEMMMKMTTDVPVGIATPDKLETRLGTLNLFDGVPDKATAQKVHDNLDFQRGVQAYLNSIQIASMYGMRKGILEFNPANTTTLLFETLMDSKALWLTPNTTSIYMVSWLEMKDEPYVIEAPPNVLGIIDDFYFEYVADFGNAGPDKGKGGKTLVIPTGYKGEVPYGYHVARSKTYGNWFIWRGFQENGNPAPAVAITKKLFCMYPLSEKDSPPKMNFINVSGKFNNTIHRMDYGFFEEVNEVIQAEPTEGQNPEILGLLASIGIKKGQPFKPVARMKKILTEAANVGAVTARAIAGRPRDDMFYFYPGEGVWTTPFPGGSHEFLDNGARVLDARTFMHFYATGITPTMTAKMVGKGSQYTVAYLDSEGNAFDGGKTYKVHLPANVPAKDFWSFTLYDNQTRAMLQTDQQFPGIDNNKKGLQQNKDGSYDIYFGPKAPKGKEANWLQTVPNKDWNMILRLYGPLQPWFDKTWQPSDPELVK